MNLMTRKEYMDSEDPDAFRRYYEQFVDDFVIGQVSSIIGLQRVAESNDPNLNDIPLGLWDRCSISSTSAAKLKEAGDFLTLSGVVCIAKAAARMALARKSQW